MVSLDLTRADSRKIEFFQFQIEFFEFSNRVFEFSNRVFAFSDQVFKLSNQVFKILSQHKVRTCQSLSFFLCVYYLLKTTLFLQPQNGFHYYKFKSNRLRNITTRVKNAEKRVIAFFWSSFCIFQIEFSQKIEFFVFLENRVFAKMLKKKPEFRQKLILSFYL